MILIFNRPIFKRKKGVLDRTNQVFDMAHQKAICVRSHKFKEFRILK